MGARRYRRVTRPPQGLRHSRAVRPGSAATVRVVRASDELLVHLRRAHDLIDRRYADPLDLDELAAVAGVSKYHFLRSFAATYGRTPVQYLTERRIERSQDLLRNTNLTVTEVCLAVGYSSLGSFSSRFREMVGISPSAYQASFATTGPPRIPGCYVFMHGLSDRRHRSGEDKSAIEEKPVGGDPS